MNQPMVHELSPIPDPAAVCAALEGLPYRIFFDSAELEGKYARYSFVAADPERVIVSKGGCTEVRQRGGDIESSGDGLKPLAAMRGMLEKFPEAVAGLPPFQGGLAGYIGYEFGSALESIEPLNPDDLEIPDLCFGMYDTVFAWDHFANRAWLISHATERQNFFVKHLDVPVTPGAASNAGSPPLASSSLSREDYRRAIEAIREYIAAGDIFQANFAQRFEAPLHAAPWELYLALRAKNPAPFACYFEAGEVTVISASPERFIRLTGNRAETRPIKGTRPRNDSPVSDRKSSEELIASVKDNAEHVMIVDVLRNDFSRVCVPGTVKVEDLASLESHPTVHHLVSTISGELQSGRDAIDLLLASIPGGSITGAPKIRAMEIIAELEPVRRDVYCGCMAYLAAGGAMDSSIVIRTFLAKGDKVYFAAGGGIVADSDPDLEFEETMHKAAALFAALDSVA